MNYVEQNSIIKSDFAGSRRLNNIFWAVVVSLGGATMVEKICQTEKFVRSAITLFL